MNKQNSYTETRQTKEQVENVAADDRQNLKTKEFLSPKKLLKTKKRQCTDDLDLRVDEAYQYLLKKRNEDNRAAKDECAIFG